jgi:chemotaxis protein MotB
MAKRRGGGGGGGGHDAAGMMRWLLTYADLITLMMAFFVIMYAMSSRRGQIQRP